MKFNNFAIFIFVFSCCTSNKQLLMKNTIVSTKIDTLDCNSYYLIKSIYLNDSTYIIHAFKNDSLFKIVSPLKEPLFLPPMLRGSVNPCEELIEGKCYALEIHSIFEISTTETKPDSSHNNIVSFGPHRGALLCNGSTITFDKESNWELYYCKNLRGKCYIKNK